ncbi:CDP-glycerol glycerophosphotransferase family protein [Pseudoxanthomonas sp. PXM01]|uniref:CDP-glycerol glycerophosphotransferase family protein n=1 Tax=Pseudoxanthomonas sp. PXM01 TaxID=2769295 RepID=UPI001783277A|nr:CDP-glycerol glycerophosphotransferase family protein [Pseudoxanthomonas sp. PXM01]MBD9469820.1 CDP-glycerol glycerophosphotransferase family protein [Pseudoxanthomonas sp. PXM01]
MKIIWAWIRGKSSVREMEEYRTLKNAGAFDAAFYKASFPAAATSRLDPITHYLRVGEKGGGKPCDGFDPAEYLAAYPDVAGAGQSPFVHYCANGWREQRDPSSGFKAAWYASQHMSAEERASLSPLRHYQLVGKAAGLEVAPPESVVANALRASGLFDEARYLALYPDVAEAGMDAIGHYEALGASEGRSPCEGFDSRYYLESYPDVVASGQNPFLHFLQHGAREGRSASADFDTSWYARVYLNGEHDTGLNPLEHYRRHGRALRYSTIPVEEPAYGIIERSGLFDRRAYLDRYADVDESGADPLLHYLRHGSAEGRVACEMFDDRYYLSNNGDVLASAMNPLAHFCESGWKELRNPGPRFDVWWYWSMHMDPRDEGVNPLVEYMRVGIARGDSTRPGTPPRPRSVETLVQGLPGRSIRRACLFAGFDKDGLVDDCVVAYVRELSRHADVYYFADCEMREGELDKLAGITKGAWAARHGAYDFGSYSELAVHRVGWGALQSYDEVLFANDSCYLLRDLDQVFEKMDAMPCDWWGLQATKGIAATAHASRNRFRDPIPLGVVKGSLLGEFEKDYTYDFHVGSYFVAYRRNVLDDVDFRRLMSSVVPQVSKKDVILKYEVGLTRYLISKGFSFNTFIDQLYPFHPAFSGWYFCLIEKGFPLLKRLLLTDNHYGVPGLSAWVDRVKEKVPGCDVGAIQRHIDRVVDPKRLALSLGSAETWSEGGRKLGRLLTDAEFAAQDLEVRKQRTWWAFPVCGFTHRFSGNERAVFEDVRNDPAITKVVLTRERVVDVEGENVHVVSLYSEEGQQLLMRCGTVFIRHSVPRNVVHPIACDLRNVINLWHGIPLKRIGYASVDQAGRLGALRDEHRKYRSVISSSEVDRMAMASAFYPLSYEDVWMTGLPRIDFILRDLDRLPEDLRQEFASLLDLMAGRKLVLFVPTFRNGQDSAYYEFSDSEKARLVDWLDRHHAVLGVREHMADTARSYSRSLRMDGRCIDLSDDAFPNIEVLYRAASVLLTDYSSCFMDFMVTGKPAVSFAFDEVQYEFMERGFFYQLRDVFPGEVTGSFDELMSALERVFRPPEPGGEDAMEWKRRLFFHYLDDGNARRVVEQVKRISDRDVLGGAAHIRWGLE